MKCPFKAAMEGKTCPMRPLFDAADRYLKACTWKDMALLKFCLFGMGLLVGALLPKKQSRAAAGIGAEAGTALRFCPGTRFVMAASALRHHLVYRQVNRNDGFDILTAAAP